MSVEFFYFESAQKKNKKKKAPQPWDDNKLIGVIKSHTDMDLFF